MMGARYFICYMIVLLWSFSLSSELTFDESECTNSLLSLINCEPFLVGTITDPSETCCVGLGSVLKSAPLCLCGVLGGNPAFSSVNLTRALLLPDKCDVPVDQAQCAAVDAPPPVPISVGTKPPSASVVTPSSTAQSQLPISTTLTILVTAVASTLLSARSNHRPQ